MDFTKDREFAKAARAMRPTPPPSPPPTPAPRPRPHVSPANAERLYTCVHRGDPTGETSKCAEGCDRSVRMEVMACSVHGECTVLRKCDKGVTVCRNCKDRQPLPGMPKGLPSPSPKPTAATTAAPSAPEVISWAYGVTTVPERKDTTLGPTLASLAKAGFPDPHLFIDGAAEDASWTRFGGPKTFRRERIKTFGNLILGLHELSIRHPRATRYAMFQDDIEVVLNLRAYLEKIEFPKNGYLNLFAHPMGKYAPDHHGFRLSDQRGLGALALVWTREGLEGLLSRPSIARNPTRGDRRAWASVDGVVVEAMKQAGVREYVHVPSLVQHTGEVSTMNNGKGQRASRHYPGSRFDALTLLAAKPTPKPAAAGRFTWISSAKLVADAAKLAAMLPDDVVGVIGIARSGLMPAVEVATRLHLPLWEVGHESGPNRVGNGRRGGWSDAKGRYALIDDTASSGKSMAAAADRCRKAGLDVIRCVVYATTASKSGLDLWAETSELPHALEWNWANNNASFGIHAKGPNAPWMAGVAVDLDGVLAADPPMAEPDGGLALEEFVRWLENAPLLNAPRRRPVKLIATGRLEKYRAVTESWLARRGIKFEKLVMSQHATAEARRAAADVAAMKAAAYSASGCGLFIESDPRQAKAIHEASGKPCVHLASGAVWQ